MIPHIRSAVLLILLTSFLLASCTWGQDGALQFADLGDFKLASGETLRGCRIGYRTYGRLNADRSNAVLVPTWFGGTSEELAGLIGPAGIVDSRRYYIVAVDALGDGVSSSPSNSVRPSREKFPHFTIRDLIETQHALLTKVLKLDHVKAVVGLSMGGMQTFQWMVAHPTFMDRAVAIVGTPRLTSVDLLLWQSQLRLIEAERETEEGRRRAMRAVTAIEVLNLRTPEYYNAHTRPEDVPKLLADSEKYFLTKDADDWASQLRAMIGHDIYAAFGGSEAKAAAAVRAPALIVVSASDRMVNPAPALAFARRIGAQTLVLPGDGGHLATLEETNHLRAALSAFLDGTPVK
jgi:homoserine O-acetyltransferase